MKRGADEKELLDSVERGEWKSVGGGKRERARYAGSRGRRVAGSRNTGPHSVNWRAYQPV